MRKSGILFRCIESKQTTSQSPYNDDSDRKNLLQNLVIRFDYAWSTYETLSVRA